MAEKRTDTSAITPQPPLDRKSVESGLITKGSVSENRVPETSVAESINFQFDTIGSATLRKGLTTVGQNLVSPILGQHYFVDTLNNGVNTQLITVSGTNVYYLAGNTWTSVRSNLTAGKKARFTTFINYTFMVNGTEATAIWDGIPADGFITSGNALNAPTGSFIEVFRGRVWIAGNTTNPDNVYYSTVFNSVTNPVIDWDTTVQFMPISPSDGEQITGLQRYKNMMLVFKPNHIFRIFDISQTEAEPYNNIGTYSNESIVETKAGVFFHHSSGFYQFNPYGTITEISRPLQIDIIKQIPVSSYSSITGWLEPDGDHICWAVGTVVVRGITYTNLTLRYTISTQIWTHYQHPYQFISSIRRQPLYNDGTTQFATVGDTAGNVFEANVGKTDNGIPISYSLIHRWENVDGFLSTRKIFDVINFTHYGGAGTEISYQTDVQDPDDLNNWTGKVGQLRTSNTGFNSINVKGRKVRFRLSGQSVGDPFTYNGYEALGILSEFIQFSKQ